MSKRITLCSGKVNRAGYRTVPEGVVLDAYEKNPVLLGMHNGQMLSIGNILEIKMEDGELTGLPVFDMDDPVAAEYARKYDKGFMRACSMGHDPLEFSEDLSLAKPGQTLATVTKTELLEVSMCNIPGDRDAVLRLSGRSKNEFGDIDIIPKLQLSKEQIINHNKIESKMDFKNIALELGLNEASTETEILSAVKTLKLSQEAAKKERVDALMTLGIEKKVITEDNRASYEKLAYADFDSTSTLIKNAEVKAVEIAKPEKQLSIKDQLLRSGGNKEMPADQPTYFKLSKENPNELLRIKNEDPELYKKLSADYAKGVK